LKVKVKMSEFFLELFSEEIPAKLQVNARKNLYDNFKIFFDENEVEIKGQIKVFSTPNRLVVYIEKIANSINKKSEEIVLKEAAQILIDQINFDKPSRLSQLN